MCEGISLAARNLISRDENRNKAVAVEVTFGEVLLSDWGQHVSKAVTIEANLN